MKSKLILLLVIGFFAPLVLGSVALAVDGQTTTTTDTTQTTDLKTKLQERLAKRKAQQQLKLNLIEQKRLQTRCKNSQGKLNNLSGRIKGTETSHAKVYVNLVDRLTSLESKLAAKGTNTTELKAEIIVLKQRIADFNANLADYKESVADLAIMDCASDPTGFKASLETARAALEKTRASSAAVKQYVNETIKPTLKTIRDALASNNTTKVPSQETN